MGYSSFVGDRSEIPWREEAKDWKQTSSNNQVLLLEYETKEELKRAGLLSAIFGR